MSVKKSPYLCLIKFQSPTSERVHLVEKTPFVVGRAQESDILFAHNSCSRKHLEISFDKERVEIKDLGSANGTYIGSQRLELNTPFLINSTTPVKIGVADEIMFFDVVPRPVELETPENREKILRSSLYEVVNGLKNFSKKEVEKEIRDEVLRRFENELQGYKDEKKKRIDEEISRFEEEKEYRKKRVDTDIAKYEEETRTKALLARTESEQMIERLNRESADRIRKSETDSANNIAANEKSSAERIRIAELESDTKIKRSENDSSEKIRLNEQKSNEAIRGNEQTSTDTIRANETSSSETIRKNEQASLESIRHNEQESSTKIRAAEVDLEGRVKKAENESNEKIRRLEIDTNERLQAQLREVQNKLIEATKEANAKSDEIIKAAKDESDRIHQLAEKAAYEMKEKTLQQADATMNETRLQAEALMKNMTEDHQKRLDEEREQRLQALRAQVTKEHEHIIKEYTEKISLLSTEHQRLTEEKAKLGELLPPLRHESLNIKALALKEATDLKEKTTQQADLLIQNAKAKAEEIVRKQTDDSNKAIAQERIDKLEQIRVEVTKEQEQVVQVYKEKITNLTMEFQTLSTEKNKLDENLPAMRSENSSLAIKIETLKKEFVFNNTEYQKVSDKLEKCLKVIKDAEVAKAEHDEVAKNKSKMENEILKLKDEAAALQKRHEDDLKRFRDDLMLKVDAEKKRANEEMNQYRNKGLGDLKDKIALEEQRITEVRKENASEIARVIQFAMSEHLGDYLTDNDLVGKISQFAFNTVKNTLQSDQSLIKPDITMLDPVQIKRTQERKKMAKYASYASATMSLVLAIIYKDPIMGYFKSHDSNSAAQQMMDQRRIQSVYDATKDPKYGTNYQKNYVENVLYMKNYSKTKMSEEYKQRWTLRLNEIELIRQLKTTEDNMIKVIAIESTLVDKLDKMRNGLDAVYITEGLENMKKIEAEEVRRMAELVNGKGNVEKIREIEKDFINSYMKANP